MQGGKGDLRRQSAEEIVELIYQVTPSAAYSVGEPKGPDVRGT